MRTRVVLAAALVALLAPAAAARADTFCVSDLGCVSGGGTPESTVQDALTAAQNNAGPDSVQLGPHTFDLAGGAVYDSTDPVSITGAGASATTLTSSSSTPSVVLLSVSSSPASTISNLGFQISAQDSWEALRAAGAISDISISADPAATLPVGIRLFGPGSSLTDSTISLSTGSNGGTGVVPCGPVAQSFCVGTGTQTISDVAITGRNAVVAESTDLVLHRITAHAGTGLLAVSSTMRVDDSLIVVPPGPGNSAIRASADPPEVDARNVTLIGPGTPGTVGFEAEQGSATLRNSVISGFETPVRRDTSFDIETDYSDYAGPVSVTGSGGTGSTTENNHIDVPPGFVNAAAGDYTLASGSALINAGDPAAPAPEDSLTDLAGAPRLSGGRLDIGAYEFQFSPVQPPPVTIDKTAPTFSSVSETNKVFAVGRSATPVSAKRVKTGTTFRYTLSEAAKVKLVIAQKLPGRRVGKACRKPSRGNRLRRHCTRFVKKGTLTRTGSAGKNSVKFSGRIGRRALKPGRYRVTIRATDAAGNVSRSRTLSFRVVKAPKKHRR